MKGLKALLNGRKGVVLLCILVVAAVAVVVGVVYQDFELVKVALAVLGAVASVFFLAVAFEDGAELRAQALFTESFEAQVDMMIAGGLRRLGLDETLIQGLRSLADAIIVTEEEQAEIDMAQKPNPGPLPPFPVPTKPAA